MQLFDVHTHLQDRRLEGLREGMIARAIEKGVVKILSCGVHQGDWEKLTEISKRFEPIIPAYGLHPWFISYRTANFLFDLEQLIKHTGASVGEIGLDRMIEDRDDDDQKTVFIEQLRIARKYEQPVSIHCRKAWKLLADILREEGGLPHGGVIHSYSGSKDMVKVFEALGASISFSGSVTNPNNKKTRQAVTAVSDDRLLVETDSPDILPHGVDTELNEPSYVPLILKEVAKLRKKSAEDIADLTWKNANRIYAREKKI